MNPALITVMRPKQWAKNLLIFAGYLFTIGMRRAPNAEERVTLAFIFFCFASSAVYILNDIIDAERDRSHPDKSSRPIASGEVSKTAAAVLAFVLLIIAVFGSLWLDYGLESPAHPFYRTFTLVLLSYFVLNTAYTFLLKNVVILDVIAVAAGFVLRAIAGAVVIQVSISEWFLLCTSLLALFIGFAKRRHELVMLEDASGEHRRSLSDYSSYLLDQLMVITAAAAIMTYSLYTFTSENHTPEQRRYMMATIPFVVYGIFRYLYLVHKRDAGGQPEIVFLTDKPLMVNILLWALAVALVLRLG